MRRKTELLILAAALPTFALAVWLSGEPTKDCRSLYVLVWSKQHNGKPQTVMELWDTLERANKHIEWTINNPRLIRWERKDVDIIEVKTPAICRR